MRKITVEKGSKHFVVYKGALYNKKKTELILYPRKSKKYKKYVIPKSVKIVDSSAFKNNCYIEKLVINGDFYDGGYDIKAFSGMKRLKTVVFKSKQLVDQISFRNCKKLEKVVLAEGTKKINSKQFYNCRNLVSINFPESLEEIADNAFEGCDKLVLPEIDESKIIHYPIY